MKCHTRCGACCIAPEISSALPNMPNGKPAGEPCVNLDEDLRCKVYDDRPAVCRDFGPEPSYCGSSHNQALTLLSQLERDTQG